MPYEELSAFCTNDFKEGQFCNLHFYSESVGFFDFISSDCHLKISLTEIEEQKPTKQRQALDRLSAKISESDLPGKEHFIDFLQSKYRRNHKANTLRATFTALNLFLSFYKKTDKVHLELITQEDLEAFVEHEQDRRLKPASVKGRLGILYAFIKFLIKSKVLSHEVLEQKIRVKLPNMLPRAIAPEDIKDLLSVIENTRDRAMILLLLRTGMRIGELLDTKVSDIDLVERKILIHQASKTDSGRVVYFSDDAGEALMAWVKERHPLKEYLFYSRGHKTLGYETARTIFKLYIEKAELSGKGYTLHCLRHTYASELLNAGMRLEYLQVLMGHTNIEVTRRYARLTDKVRENEYFTAMKIIQRGEIDGFYQLDSEL